LEQCSLKKNEERASVYTGTEDAPPPC
jgi:hypothetical protein